MDPRQEARLIHDVLQGRPQAFRTLVEPYLSLYRAATQRILPVGPTAQEPLEEALLAIREALPAFRGEPRFATWSYRICIEQALKIRRRQMGLGTQPGAERPYPLPRELEPAL